MFNLFKKKQEKDPICGMIANEKFISRHGKRFCSEHCVAAYESKNNIGDKKEHTHDHGCGCCG